MSLLQRQWGPRGAPGAARMRLRNAVLTPVPALLVLFALLPACRPPVPESEPEPPQEGGPSVLERTPPCGTLQVDVVRASEGPSVGIQLVFSCRENSPGVCAPSECVPCWERSGSLTVLSCVCKSLCNPATPFDPPRPEDFEARGDRPGLEP